jgi:hypothetical protein
MARDATTEEFDDLTKFKVAHGRITDKFSGESVLHAWVEKGDMIFDWQTHSTRPDGIDRATYYDIFQPEVHDEYTAEETMTNCLKSGGKAGPWTETRVLENFVKQEHICIIDEASPVSESMIRACVRGLLLEQEVKYQGILKVMPSQDVVDQVSALVSQLPHEAVVLPEDKFHVTLAHQSVLKPYRKQIKQLVGDMMLPPPPPVVLDATLEERTDELQGRKSWVAWVKNQDALRGYVNQVMEMVGGPTDPEPDRRFHISIANLTGNPGDSVR